MWKITYIHTKSILSNRLYGWFVNVPISATARTCMRYFNDKVHNETGPAYYDKCSNRYQCFCMVSYKYFIHNKIHRIPGIAYITHNGSVGYYYNGQYITGTQWTPYSRQIFEYETQYAELSKLNMYVIK